MTDLQPRLASVLLFVATSAAADVVIEEPWAPATPPAATVAAGCLAITNTESTPDHLIGATSPVAERVEMHVTFTENGIAKNAAAGRSVVPGEARLALKPGAGHLMCVGL